MNLFSNFYRLTDGPGPDRPPPKGVARYFRVFWDNLGKLLAVNLFCFGGFLPMALLVSLGTVLENFWLALLGGLVGGAVAGPFWTASLALSLLCFQGSPYRWFPFWRHAFAQSWRSSAAQGAVVGGLFGAVAAAWSFLSAMAGQNLLPAPAVLLFLGVDCFVLALAAALLFPPLCFEARDLPCRLRDAAAILNTAPGRAAGAVGALLAWVLLFVALFPVSVPFALVLGFWPILLLQAQLLEPALLERYHVSETFSGMELAEDEAVLSRAERSEIWWRRFWPLAIGIAAAVSLALGVAQVMLNTVEPDLQIAVVHAEELPDGVRTALERSLTALAEDRNGDGRVVVQLNDYVLRFDGQGTNGDLQAAGVTRLVSDLSAGDSALLVVEDAAGFLGWYGDRVNGDAARPWVECPPLSGLDAGRYTSVEDLSADRTGQDLLAGYTVFPALNCPEGQMTLLMG